VKKFFSILLILMMLVSFNIKGMTIAPPLYEINASGDTIMIDRIWHNLFVGYVGNFKDNKKGVKTYHGLEFGYAQMFRSKFFTAYSYCGSTELLTDFKNVIVAPKIGINGNLFILLTGIETAFYTDFKNNSLHLMPYIGAGIGSFKSTVRFNIPLYNKDVFNINTISLTLSFPIITTKSNF